jgi:hypothetical protein
MAKSWPMMAANAGGHAADPHVADATVERRRAAIVVPTVQHKRDAWTTPSTKRRHFVSAGMR